jgi:Tfp pilus assembly protein PilN
LEEIASRTPDRLWITKLDAKGKNLQLHGMSLDNEIVAEFLTKLNDSKYFRDVELKVTDLQKKGGLKVHRFQLSAVITSPELEAKKKADAAKKAKAPKKKKSAKKKRGAKKASVLSPLIADVR